MPEYTLKIEMRFKASNAYEAREWARNVRHSVEQIQTNSTSTEFNLLGSLCEFLDYRHIDIDNIAERAPTHTDCQDQ